MTAERVIGFIGHPDAGKTELVRRVQVAAPVPCEPMVVPADAFLDFWLGWPVWTWKPGEAQ